MSRLSRSEWAVSIAAVLVWSVLAYLFIFVFAGSHPCSILAPVGVDGTIVQLTQDEINQRVADCAGRPDIGAMTVFGIGYIVLAVLLVRQMGRR